MNIIRAAQCRRMPWKNGGGETAEIATDPPGAGLEHFTWRFSAARVAQDGPFSVFPGIDRTLAVLSGEGLELRLTGHAVRLVPGDPPYSFPGDQPVEGRLLGGSVEDLNIMTRRGAVRHRMRRMAVEGTLDLTSDTMTLLLFCAEGHVRFDDQVLAPRDTAVLEETKSRNFRVDGRGVLHVVEIDREA